MDSSRKLALAVLLIGASVVAAPSANAKVSVRFQRMAGFRSPGTPAKYDKVGVIKTGSPKAKNVLVLNPGTSASAAYFEPLAKDIVTRAYMIEFWGAGDAARERWKLRRDRTGELMKTLHKLARKEDPSIVRVSDTVVGAVVGGVNRVLISHVLSGDPAPLRTLKPELLRFIKLTLASHEES